MPRPSRLVLTAAAAAVVLAALSLADPRGVRQLRLLRAEIERQQAVNRALRQSNASLAQTAKSLRAPVDLLALERAAREELGFVKPDELIFRFEPPGAPQPRGRAPRPRSE